jgi:hypothetical protein
VYGLRTEIHPVFPDIRHAYRRSFADWFVKYGASEHGLDPELSSNMRDSLLKTPKPPLVFQATAKLRPWVVRWQKSAPGQRLSRSTLASAVGALFSPDGSE